MSGLEVAMVAGSTILSAVGSAQQGRAQQRAANYQAAQYEQQAGQERASAQRAAIEEHRKATLAQSRALAVSAASGAGASDPTVMNIMGDLGSEGEYRALSALYEGEERARGLQMGAQAKRYEGATAKQAGNMRAASTILSGGMSLYDKYDGGSTSSAPAYNPQAYGPYDMPWLRGPR